MKAPLKSLLFISYLFITVIAGNAGAQPPDVPPGLLNAPPCGELEMPTQAKVPCTGIVQFPEGTSLEQRSEKVKAHGATMRFNYNNISAAAVYINDEAVLNSLLSDGEVVDVIPDRLVGANAKPGTGGGSAGQVIPEGVKRIGATPGTLPVTGAGVGVAIVDTGLDLVNTDLTISPSCFTAYSSCQDGDGHGTHVGGIVAANNNTVGVVGVAPGATLYAVKVLDNNGFGSDSTVMAGLDWVADNADLVNPAIQVVNMSLGRDGTLNDNPLYRQAVQALANAGITVVVAAGNDQSLEVADNVPATYPEVLAVASSTAVNGSNAGCRGFTGTIPADTASVFTTDGAFDDATGIGVTISAPGGERENVSKSCFLQGVGILSLKAGGGTTRMSGTSMASPHVAGVAALLQQQSGGTLDSESIRDLIMNSASRIGVAPLNSPTSSYSFDGEREGILSACRALGVCP